MPLLGSITSSPDPPGIDLRKWIGVIGRHPNLARFPDREGLDPFTRASVLYRGESGDARVMADGAEVGVMTWAQDGTHRIAVEGNRKVVEPLALEVASRLGGTYRRG